MTVRSNNRGAPAAGLRIPPPSGDRVHVWRVPLDFSKEGQALAHNFLSEEELKRSASILGSRESLRFEACRASLRSVLGGYLGLPPASFEISISPSGKPYLAGTDLSFSVSHAGGLALLAFARGMRLGIDLERVKGRSVPTGLAERFLSSRLPQMGGAPLDGISDGFFERWTLAEAFLKMRSLGVSQLMSAKSGLHNAIPLPTLLRLDVGSGYCSSLVVEREACRVSVHKFDESMLSSMPTKS